jgi:peptidoglycan hydrolase-like protein with peptidoglycan-binding domain
MTRDEIIILQIKLNQLGYGPIQVDGQYGKNTENAYRRYLDELDPNVPTVIPPPEQKWWMSKALIASVATVLVSLIGLFGYEVDAQFATQMILSVITLVTGMMSVIGTVKRKGAIDTTYVNPFNQPKPLVPESTEYVDPRGNFQDH